MTDWCLRSIHHSLSLSLSLSFLCFPLSLFFLYLICNAYLQSSSVLVPIVYPPFYLSSSKSPKTPIISNIKSMCSFLFTKKLVYNSFLLKLGPKVLVVQGSLSFSFTLCSLFPNLLLCFLCRLLILTHSYTRSCKHSHTLTCTHSPMHANTHSCTHTPTFTHALTHTHTLTHALTHPHSLMHSHTHTGSSFEL